MRRKNLKAQYMFDCQCVACEKDYPPFVNLALAPAIPEIVKDKDLRALSSFNLNCEHLYLKYCAFLTKYDEHYPCQQLTAAQECMKMCYNIMNRNVPLALRVLPVHRDGEEKDKDKEKDGKL